MSTKRQPHTDELSKVPSPGLRDVATTTLRQLRPQSRETRLFVLQYQESNTVYQQEGTRRMVTAAAATAGVVDSQSASHKQGS